MRLGFGTGVMASIVSLINGLLAPMFSTIPVQNLLLDGAIVEIDLETYNIGSPVVTFTDINLPTGVTRVGSVVTIDPAAVGEVTDLNVIVRGTNEKGSNLANITLNITSEIINDWVINSTIISSTPNTPTTPSISGTIVSL